MFLALARPNPFFYYACMSVVGRIAAKKRAKVRKNSDMTKYFLKKMQKIFIFLNFVMFG